MRDNITLALAIIGSGLGIANLIIDLWRNRVRLKVVPKLYVRSAQGSYSYDRPMDDFLKQQNLNDDPKLCVEIDEVSAGRAEQSVKTAGLVTVMSLQ
jgi:hypothetical protein